MKRVLSLIFALVFMFVCGVETFAYNEDVLIYENKKYGVKTYRNAEKNEMYSEFSLENASVGDEIILYQDALTGDTISILYTALESRISPRISGTSGWSAGYLPDGITTFTPKIETGMGILISYKVTISAYPVYFLNTSSPVITGAGLTINSYNHSVINGEATNNYPAKAEMEFNVSYEQYGINPGAMVGYLTFEANVNGQVKTTWRY